MYVYNFHTFQYSVLLYMILQLFFILINQNTGHVINNNVYIRERFTRSESKLKNNLNRKGFKMVFNGISVNE